jgi:hypothetical protein
MNQMDRALAIVAGTFGLIGLIGFGSLLYLKHLTKKINRLRREQQKS